MASDTHSAQNSVNQSVTTQSRMDTEIVPTSRTLRSIDLFFENQIMTATLPAKKPTAATKCGHLDAPSWSKTMTTESSEPRTQLYEWPSLRTPFTMKSIAAT